MSRSDISYATMRLSGYNASSTLETFHALNNLLYYIYHLSNIFIMYIYGTHEAIIQSCTVKSHTEILDPEKKQGIMVYTDTDASHDIKSRRSVSSNIIDYNGTVIACSTHNQNVPSACTNITDSTSIYNGVKKALEIRRILE